MIIYLNMNTLFDDQQATPDDLYVMRNSQGVEAAFAAASARLIYLKVPGKDGSPTNVALGSDSTQPYPLLAAPDVDTLIGHDLQVAVNRRMFTLADKDYHFTTSTRPKTGGGKSYDPRSKKPRVIRPGKQSITFIHKHENGRADFMGDLSIMISYTLTDTNELKVDYQVNTDQYMAVNLANHTFFNLNGEGSGTVNRHLLMIGADKYTLVDAGLMPTGEIETVKDTPFDFTKATAIGARINDNNEQLKNARGYDHNFVLNRHSHKTPVAKMIGDKSGILMEIFTNQPGLQFYCGNFMQNKNPLHQDAHDEQCTGFCLAGRQLPGLLTQPAFPAELLTPGKNYPSTTVYRFTSDFNKKKPGGKTTRRF